jgi:hypothetical protein
MTAPTYLFSDELDADTQITAEESIAYALFEPDGDEHTDVDLVFVAEHVLAIAIERIEDDGYITIAEPLPNFKAAFAARVADTFRGLAAGERPDEDTCAQAGRDLFLMAAAAYAPQLVVLA